MIMSKEVNFEPHCNTQEKEISGQEKCFQSECKWQLPIEG